MFCRQKNWFTTFNGFIVKYFGSNFIFTFSRQSIHQQWLYLNLKRIIFVPKIVWSSWAIKNVSSMLKKKQIAEGEEIPSNMNIYGHIKSQNFFFIKKGKKETLYLQETSWKWKYFIEKVWKKPSGFFWKIESFFSIQKLTTKFQFLRLKLQIWEL